VRACKNYINKPKTPNIEMSGLRKCYALVPECTESDLLAERRALAKVSAAGDDHFPCHSWGHNDLFGSDDGPAVGEAWGVEDFYSELNNPSIIPPEPIDDQGAVADLEALLSGANAFTKHEKRDFVIDNAPDVLTREEASNFVSALLETYDSLNPAEAIQYVMRYAVPIAGLRENGYNPYVLAYAVETLARNDELNIQDRIEMVRKVYASVLDRDSALRLRRNLVDAMLDSPSDRGRAKKETITLIEPNTPPRKIGVNKHIYDYSRDAVIDDVSYYLINCFKK
jgi:hypothetical protein